MRGSRVFAGVVLAVALVAATSPVWRVLLLGSDATLDELMQLRCTAVK